MNKQTGPVRFGSKVDPMIVAVMAGSFALPVAIGISRFLRSGTLWPNLVLLLILIPVGALELFLFRNTYYLVTDDELIVHCLFRTAIPLGGIQTLRPTRNLLAAPALSLDRIEVSRTAGPLMLVSPKDKGAFIRAIKARAPQVLVEGFQASDVSPPIS